MKRILKFFNFMQIRRIGPGKDGKRDVIEDKKNKKFIRSDSLSENPNSPLKFFPTDETKQNPANHDNKTVYPLDFRSCLIV